MGGEHIALELHQVFIGCGTTVYLKYRHLIPILFLHQKEKICDLIGDAFHTGLDDLVAPCGSCHTGQQTGCLAVPVR